MPWEQGEQVDVTGTLPAAQGVHTVDPAFETDPEGHAEHPCVEKTNDRAGQLDKHSAVVEEPPKLNFPVSQAAQVVVPVCPGTHMIRHAAPPLSDLHKSFRAAASKPPSTRIAPLGRIMLA